MKEESPAKNEIKEKIGDIKELRAQLKIKDEELENHMENTLTLIQQAQYLIFSTEFYREMRTKLEKARAMIEWLKDKKKKKY